MHHSQKLEYPVLYFTIQSRFGFPVLPLIKDAVSDFGRSSLPGHIPKHMPRLEGLNAIVREYNF